MARPIESRAIAKAYREALIAEQKMSRINNEAIKEIRLIILRSGDETYNYNETIEKRLKRKLAKLKRKTLLAQSDLQAKVEAITVATMIEASRININLSIARKIIKNTKLDSFSRKMRPSFNEYADDLLRHLKVSIGQGKSTLKLAKELTKLDPAKVDIPKYISEISQAARKAVISGRPEDYAVFKRAIARNRSYISNLSRAGEKGFESVGLRSAGNRFVRDIQKAVNENTIDNVINKWGKSKLEYIQKRVARTETSHAYHQYLAEYGYSADHIIGLRVRLSPSHPIFDSCDAAVGDYLFSEYSLDDIPIPPYSELHHPQCICILEYIFDEGFLSTNKYEEAA